MSKELLNKIRILFIEDDDIQRNELLTFLSRRVNKVYTASNGEEGYIRYKAVQPDIIITDLRMPRMDGIELVKKIREEDRLIPIIVATAMNDKETILESVDIGITNYLVKPVDTNELIGVLIESVKTILAINQGEFDELIDKSKINDLKNQLTKYFKNELGKGPSDIRVSVLNDVFDVYLQDCLTTYEKNMLKYKKNIQLVNHYKNIFIEDRLEEIEEILSENLNIDYKIIEVKSNAAEGEVIIKCKLE